MLTAAVLSATISFLCWVVARILFHAEKRDRATFFALLFLVSALSCVCSTAGHLILWANR